MDNQTIDLPHSEFDVAEQVASEFSAAQILEGLAKTEGEISDALSEDQLTDLGSKVIEDYETDKSDREEWERIARDALEKAGQEKGREEKTYPWSKASNVQYPLLTVAALQFNARAYPAIVKGDEAVSVKVVGADKGVPRLGPDGQPLATVNGLLVVPTPQGPAKMAPQGPVPVPEGAQPQIVWARPPGAKAPRARRVKDYLYATIFYRMDRSSRDTVMPLMQLPLSGRALRNVYYRLPKHSAKLGSTLN